MKKMIFILGLFIILISLPSHSKSSLEQPIFHLAKKECTKTSKTTNIEMKAYAMHQKTKNRQFLEVIQFETFIRVNFHCDISYGLQIIDNNNSTLYENNIDNNNLLPVNIDLEKFKHGIYKIRVNISNNDYYEGFFSIK